MMVDAPPSNAWCFLPRSGALLAAETSAFNAAGSPGLLSDLKL